MAAGEASLLQLSPAAPPWPAPGVEMRSLHCQTVPPPAFHPGLPPALWLSRSLVPTASTRPAIRRRPRASVERMSHGLQTLTACSASKVPTHASQGRCPCPCLSSETTSDSFPQTRSEREPLPLCTEVVQIKTLSYFSSSKLKNQEAHRIFVYFRILSVPGLRSGRQDPGV